MTLRSSPCQAGKRFAVEVVSEHIKRHHPGCPADASATLALEIAGRRWAKVTLGKAVGMVITNYVRHHLTDYEQLLKVPGLSRLEARRTVASEVSSILSAWSSAKAGGRR